MALIQKLGLAAFGLMIGIIAAEAISRGVAPKDSVFWNSPMMMPYSGGSFDPNTTAEQMHANSDPNRIQKYVPDSHRWYRLDPEPAIPSSGRLVLNFGDSSTWGWGLTDRRYSYANALNEMLPKGITSINLGVPYYTTLEGLKYLQEFVPRYAGRAIAVTLYFGNNDATENGSSDEAVLRRISQTTRLQCQLSKRFALYRLIRTAMLNLRAGSYNDSPRVSPDEYEANLKAMVGLCQRYGIPVVIIEPIVPLSWQPGYIKYHVSLKGRVRNPWSASELKQAEALYGLGLEQMYSKSDSCEQLLRQASEHDWVIPRLKTPWRSRLSMFDRLSGVKVIRLQGVFVEAEYPYTFEDYCHPGARAHYQIASQVAQALGP